MSDLNLAIKLTTAGGKVVVKDLREIDNAADKVNHSLTGTGKSGAVAKQGFDRATTGSTALTSSLKSTIAQAAGIIGLGVAINSLVRSVIEVGNVTSGWDAAMQAISGSQYLANEQLQHSRDLSNQLGLDIRSTTDSYVQFTAATKDTALEGFKTNKVFDAISMSMRVLNRSADDTSGALKALEQMVSKGTVQAEELRGQLGERLPGAFNLAARAMGVTTKQLGKMLEGGKVLAEDLLPKLADVLTQKYGKGLEVALNSPAQAFRNLKNETFEFNEALSNVLFDDFSVIAQGLATGLEGASENLPTIISTIEALSVVIGGHLVKALIASGSAMLANAIATNTQLQANIKLQASELILAKSAQHKAVQEQLAAKRSLAMANTTYARSRAINSLSAANGKAIATERALTIATLAHDSAMKKATITSRVLGGSMALIGGPVGVAILAAYALYEMTSGMEAAKTASEQLEAATGKTTKSIEEMTAAEQKQTAAQYAKLIQNKQAEIVKLNQSIQDNIERGSRSGSDAAFSQAQRQSEDLERHKKGLENLIVAYSKVQGVLFDAGMAGIEWNTVISNGSDVTATLTKDTQSLVDRLDPLLAKSKQFGTEMHQLHQSYLSGALGLVEYKKLVKLLGEEFKKSTATKKVELTTNQKLIASLGEQVHTLGLTAKQKLINANLSKLSATATAEEIAAINALSAAQYEQLQISEQKESDSDYYQKVIDGANDIGESWNTAGNVIVNTFGTIGEQLDKLAQQQESYATKQKKLAADKVKYADDPKKLNEIAKAENALAKQKSSNAMSEISSYRAITDSAAQMFSENSKGRQAMQAASDVFTAIELANSALRIGSYAIEAVAAAFAAPWPIGFASGAAMIAIMAGLGVAISGGSGSAPMSSEQRQKTQSTGTVLGSDEKSQSLLNSYERIEELALDQYSVLREMNTSLHDLNNNITHLATSFVSNFGKFDGDSYGGQLGETSKYNTNGKFESIDGKLDVIFGSLGGSILDSIVGGFSTKKKSLVDSGISIVSQTLGEIINTGLVEAQAYFDIKTKKKSFWGLKSKTSYNTEYQDVNQQLEHELALIFADIGSSITSAVDVLGFDITRTLDSFVIDLPNISFKDLSGDEIKAELEAMFSSQADMMATYLVPGLAEFQKVGEGLYETLIRLAQEQAVFNSVLEITGNTLANVDATQTIAATQAIIGFAGSIENLQSAASTFFNEFYSEAEQFEHMQKQLNAQFSALGLTVPKTKEGFRDLVSALDPLNEADQKLYAQLLLLSGQTAEYYKTLEQQEQALKSFNQNIVDQLQSLDFTPLQSKLHDLQEEFDQYRNEAIELGADPALLEQLYAKRRQEIIDEALLAVNNSHEKAMDTLTSDHEKAVNELVSNNDKLVSAFSSLNASIANGILSIRRQGNNWNESNYQSGQISDFSKLIGQGSIKEQISNLDSLQQAHINKYNAELAGLTSTRNAAQSSYDEQLNQIEARYQIELEVYDNMRSALDSLKEAVDNLLLSDLSTLTNEQRLSEAKTQYQSTLSKAQKGDANAVSQLSGAQSNYLTEAQSYYASSDNYQNIFDKVFDEVSNVANTNIVAPKKPIALPVPDEIKEHNEAIETLQNSTISELTSLRLLSQELENQNQAAFELAMFDLQFKLDANTALLIEKLELDTLAINTQASEDTNKLNMTLENQIAISTQQTELEIEQTVAINKMNKDINAGLDGVVKAIGEQNAILETQAKQQAQDSAEVAAGLAELQRQQSSKDETLESILDEIMVAIAL